MSPPRRVRGSAAAWLRALEGQRVVVVGADEALCRRWKAARFEDFASFEGALDAAEPIARPPSDHAPAKKAPEDPPDDDDDDATWLRELEARTAVVESPVEKEPPPPRTPYVLVSSLVMTPRLQAAALRLDRRPPVCRLGPRPELLRGPPRQQQRHDAPHVLMSSAVSQGESSSS